MSDQLRVSISYEVGIDPEIMKKIEELIDNSKFGVTVADVKRALGMTRTTAKKYLEAMVSLGKVNKEKRGIIVLYYKNINQQV
jgi:response regulator of citrate/malate metabolism